MLRGGKQEHRPWKRPAQSATSRETVALPKWSLADTAASNVKLSEGVSGEKNVLVLFLRPPGHWLLKNFELSERKEGGKGERGRLTSSWRAASSAAARAVRGHIFTRVLRTLPAPFRLPGNSTDLSICRWPHRPNPLSFAADGQFRRRRREIMSVVTFLRLP